jgi:hypothetical protein
MFNFMMRLYVRPIVTTEARVYSRLVHVGVLMGGVVLGEWMRWAGHVARVGEERGVHRVLVGKPEGKRPLGRPRRRWEDNIKMDL